MKVLVTGRAGYVGSAVQDCAKAFVSALSMDPGVYNVGFDNYRVRDVADAVRRCVNRPIEVDHLGVRDPGPSDHVDFAADSGQGFQPMVGLESGIPQPVDRFTTARQVIEHA